MTGSTTYHCLIAGLPELDLTSHKTWVSSRDFRLQLEQELHPDDFGMVKLLLLKLDNDHLVDFIEHGSFNRREASNFSLKDSSTRWNSLMPSCRRAIFSLHTL